MGASCPTHTSAHWGWGHSLPVCPQVHRLLDTLWGVDFNTLPAEADDQSLGQELTAYTQLACLQLWSPDTQYSSPGPGRPGFYILLCPHLALSHWTSHFHGLYLGSGFLSRSMRIITSSPPPATPCTHPFYPLY